MNQPNQPTEPTRPIERVLVANRTEIASRVMATCRRLGVGTAVVHSDPDAALPFVAEADVAVRLPGAAAADTYLRADLVVAAARAVGADAVHPGYGFLSENAEAARAVRDAGLVWIGPDPESIASMGSKVEAKRIVAAVGVPVLGEVDPATAGADDLPLLVKASAGGGGRGMRVVRSLDVLGAEVERAAAEAESAFGDPTVYCEPYVERSRHVEVQVMGDRHGTLWVLGERDCSLQRRHQKVVEESPAPHLPAPVRERMYAAARAAASAIGYVGAGTVEFLYDGADRFFFLEMNTRLQVEHTVTECVLGLDLVELQLRVAQGRPLGDQPQPRGGHAIEARLYAEDPSAGWAPASGPLRVLDIPADVRFAVPAEPGVRLDAGYSGGEVVGTHYDAMLAKVIAWAPTREDAARRLAAALHRARIHGVRTNRDLLVRVLREEAFLAGAVHTAYLDDLDRLTVDQPSGTAPAAAGALVHAVRAHEAAPVQRGIPTAWRNVPSQWQVSAFGDREVRWRATRSGFEVDTDLCVVSVDGAVAVIEEGGARRRYAVTVAGADVDVDSSLGHVHLEHVPALPERGAAAPHGSLVSAMPGQVVEVLVEPGSRVVRGERLVVIEAMKMQHAVEAPGPGLVSEVHVSVGDQVAAGMVLVVHEGDQPDDAGGEPPADEEET